MARHVEAWMDGTRLSDIGPIIIQDVNELPPDMEITYGVRAIRSGQNIQKYRRKSLRLTIEAAVRELFDLGKRTAVQQAMAGWASGSILELSSHPGQQLHVICKNVPTLGKIRDYTSILSIELEADIIPFWEEKMSNEVTGTGSSGSATLLIPGTASEIPVEATFTPSGTITTLTVTVVCGGVTRSIALSGFSTSSAVVFGRDSQDRLTITAGSSSLLPYRLASSADDLIVPHGNATVSWSASGSGTMKFSARGRWL